jgi:molecular chaperone Hsp33
MNEVQSFLLEDANIRGAIVRLEETWQHALARHDYPSDVRALLGESMAATVLLATGLKGSPTVSMQLQGEGPVKLLLIQCSSDLKVRGLAQWRDRARGEALLGAGRMAVTLDPGETGRCFQGIVPIVSDSVDACLETYFRQSEQLPTRLVLRGDEKRVGGLMVQVLPGRQSDRQAFEAVASLASTVSASELNELPAASLLTRLFDDYPIRLFRPRPVLHDCRCTAEHLAGVLRMLGAAELEDLLATRGQVELTCEFCNRAFRYDQDDIDAVLRGEAPGARLH